jgi:hypothetical protein
LAELIGISCPHSIIINVDYTLLDQLPNIYIEFDKECNIGVGSMFISDLTPFPKPKNYNEILKSKTFKNINYDHLCNTISSNKQFSQLYGMKVFTDWINLSDYHKYENLCLHSNDTIIFLDFDLAFSSNNGSWEIPEKYESNAMISHQAPFWDGLIENKEVYNPWMENILHLSEDDIKYIFLQIPDCWEIPDIYITSLIDFLLNNRNQFITAFFSALDFRETIDAIEHM